VIFVTVGTHEQPMDRLMEALDALPPEILPDDEQLVVQYGWSTWVPMRANASKLLGFDEVQAHMAAARIVITHGGPASIMQALSHGKVPVVVPRQAHFGEHVDDHQVLFARRVADRVTVVLDIADLPEVLRRHAARVAKIDPASFGRARADAFAARFDAMCRDLCVRRR
jgi:UDP-N-acetylglucosamine transferase subunit ALG13